MNQLLSPSNFVRFTVDQHEYVYFPGNSIQQLTNRTIEAYFDACEMGVVNDNILSEKADEITSALNGRLVFPVMNSDFKQNNAMLTINTTNGCNMACKYCFAPTSKSEIRSISIETIVKATNDLLKNYPQVECYTIYFFGGEPLMRKKFIKEAVDVIKGIVKRQSKKVKFIMTTNGTLLEQSIIEFLKREEFHVVLSIDGNAQHNINRVFRNGKESFSSVIAKIKLLKENNVSMHIRATFNPQMENLIDAVKFFESLDVVYDYEFTLGSNTNDVQYTRFSKDRLLSLNSEIESITNYLINKIEHGEKINCSSFSQKLAFIKNNVIRFFGCEAGRNAMIVDECGNYYPCQNMLSFIETRMGDTISGINYNLRDKYKSQLFSEYQKCTNCWARYLCGGGCQAERLMDDSNIETAVCELIKMEWLYALKAYTKLMKFGKSINVTI
ncbi:uncharacterized protein M2137_001864 [Parabacteroides sp. PFB2-10]|uniref:radical SAM/SPASM domain-containing protein n=1 Tax=Parabacteroides sp. PFB2-10 TaxID=1742405 RepID=UPI0024768714|nr:radical SAM protein [Parabacteroides sp. PFB2-10]MDH6313077.1 uncharacterized protein [Parabacteroides sp. PFB2-10]MDL2245015.1 radical SAM protein [Parabacteroides sp. OttesenSCG-928-J18]